MTNRDENLTTEGARDPELVLGHFRDTACVLLCIGVTSDADASLSSEKIGNAVHRIWSQILREAQGLHGCRWMWGAVLFAGPVTEADQLSAAAGRLAKEAAEADVEIRIVWKIVGADEAVHGKLRIADDMFEELSSPRNFGKLGDSVHRATYQRQVRAIRVRLADEPLRDPATMRRFTIPPRRRSGLGCRWAALAGEVPSSARRR